MVLIDSVKYACATCIKGHRSSTCNHDTRPLIEIKKKGRPVTQCVHCRELRKTKQVHVKCLCEGRPDASATTPRTVIPPAAVHVAHSSQPSTTSPTTAGPRTGTSLSEPSCDCKTRGGSCECCTPKHAPRQTAANTGSSGGKPPGLTRGHTYHASSSSAHPSMTHDASHQRSATVNKHGGALQRSATVHGAAVPANSSSHHSNSHNGSHHPQPQHHPARHFAPYTVAHHTHHHHARFDLPPEEDDASESSFGASISAIDGVGIPRRHRSSSISNGDLARPFPPPAPMYLNSTATMSLPDVLAWNSTEINPLSPYTQQQLANMDPQQQQQLADAARSSNTFLPSAGAEFDHFSATSAVGADDFIRQLERGANSHVFVDEPISSEEYVTNPSDITFGASGGLPEFRFASAEVALDQLDDASAAFDYSDAAALGYGNGGVNSAPGSSDYDAVMSSFLSFPQQAMPAYTSDPGTVGSSGPPSMTGSLTSRSSSRASGGMPSALDILEMTAVANAEVVDRGRAPRGFPPIADAFENEATTAIPSFDAFERPIQSQQRHLNSLEVEKSLSLSHSHSPMSQDSVSSAQDDGNGTQFPAWPQQPSPVSAASVVSATASSTSGFSPFYPIEFQTPAGAAGVMYAGQRGHSLEFDDSAWNPRA